MEKSNYWKIRPEAAAKFVQDLKHELNSDHSCWEDLGENYKELYIEVFEKALPVLFGWNVPSVIPEVRELYEIGKQAYWDQAEKGGSDVEFEEARAAAIRDRILSCFPPVPLSLNAEGLAVRMCEIPDGGGNLPKPWRSRPRYEQEFLLRSAAFVRDRTLLATTNSGVNDNDPETFQDCERLIKQWDTVNVEAFLDAAQNKQTGAFNVQRLLYLIDVLSENRKPKTLPDREKIAKILRAAPGEWVDALDKTWDRVKDMYFDQTDAVLAYLEPWLQDPAEPVQQSIDTDQEEALARVLCETYASKTAPNRWSDVARAAIAHMRKRPKGLPTAEELAEIACEESGINWNAVGADGRAVRIRSINAILAALAPWLRDPVGKPELDVTAKEYADWKLTEFGAGNSIVNAQKSLDWLRSRIKPVMECKECAKVNAANHELCSRIEAAIVDLKGE